MLLKENILQIVKQSIGNEFYLWRSVFWNLRAGQFGQKYHQDIWPWWDIWPEKKIMALILPAML